MSFNLPAIKPGPDSSYPTEPEKLPNTKFIEKKTPIVLSVLDELFDADSINGVDVEDGNPETNDTFNGDLAKLRSYVLKME